jgi:predicted transcriptional regulator
MYEMRNTHILQLDELNSPEYRDEGKKSVEQAYDAETGEPTKTSEAQEILLNLILNLGGIRKEVWEYLITPRFQEPQAVASVGRLLCYAAPLEWMELSVEALSRMAGTMYVNEITEAYQSDIPFDEVKHIFEISDTVFEMCQRRREYCKKHEVVKRQHPDNMTGSEEKQHPDSMTGSEERQHLDNMTGSERTKIMNSIEKTVVNAVTEALQLYEKNTGLKQHPDSVTGSEEEEHPDSVTGSEMADGSDILDHRILVMDLKKEQEKSEKRISFFQILLRRHMKKEFSKLEKDDQVGKIFEIMVNKKYDKNQILSIRRLMNGGMTNEFIFSLLEKDLPETELNDLCESLLREETDKTDISDLLDTVQENKQEEVTDV